MASENVKDFYKIAIPADSIVRAIAYAIEQPTDVDRSFPTVRVTSRSGSSIEGAENPFKVMLILEANVLLNDRNPSCLLVFFGIAALAALTSPLGLGMAKFALFDLVV